MSRGALCVELMRVLQQFMSDTAARLVLRGTLEPLRLSLESVGVAELPRVIEALEPATRHFVDPSRRPLLAAQLRTLAQPAPAQSSSAPASSSASSSPASSSPAPSSSAPSSSAPSSSAPSSSAPSSFAPSSSAPASSTPASMSAPRGPAAPQTPMRPTTYLVRTESDASHARQAARALCESMGGRGFECQKVATAVSELARNQIAYAGGGTIQLSPEDAPRRLLRVRAEDQGRGIPDLERVLSGTYRSKTGMGLGLLGVKRLADRFDVRTSPTGTQVEFEVWL